MADMSDEGNRAEEAMLAEARVEVSYADHKASMVLAALGIGFGALIGGLLAGDWRPADQGDGELAWWVGLGFAVAAVSCAAAAVWPRYPPQGKSEGVYFWGDVASMKSFDELAKRLDKAPPSLGVRTRSQLWALSRTVSTKYRLIRGAFMGAALAIVAFAVSAALA
jgi:hypothetical protein